MFKYIKRKWKQLWCKHDWRPKGESHFSSNALGFTYFAENRCVKCKKITQINIRG